jgi:DNA-binding transcriptional LysR family regulator
MMDLDQLSAFVAIAQRGTVTAAARKLHRSQSALSRRLSLLEHALGAPLFDRHGPRLALTDVGRVFLPFAENALATVASGREAAQSQLAPRAGTVSVAIVGMLVEAPLARALGGLVRSAVKLSVLTTTSTEVSRLVRRGEANLGVRYFADEDPALVSEPIGVERMCVVSAKRAQRKREVIERPAAAQQWIGFPPGRSAKEDFGRLLRQQLAAAGVSQAAVMSVDSVSAQKRLAEAGLGLALLPESSVREELERGSLRLVDMPRVATVIPISLVWRRSGYMSPAAREVVATLKGTFLPTLTAKNTPRR